MAIWRQSRRRRERVLPAPRMKTKQDTLLRCSGASGRRQRGQTSSTSGVMLPCRNAWPAFLQIEGDL